MKFALSLVMFGTLQAAATEKPACNAKTRGHFWPEEANIDKLAARKYLQYGDLQMCTMGTWKYHWQPLSVRAPKSVSATTAPDLVHSRTSDESHRSKT